MDKWTDKWTDGQTDERTFRKRKLEGKNAIHKSFAFDRESKIKLLFGHFKFEIFTKQ